MKQLLIKCNVGPRERYGQYMLGFAAMIGAFFARRRATKMALRAVGFAGLATAVTRFSLVNEVLGIDNGQAAYRAFPHVLRRL